MDEFHADLHCHTTCSDGTLTPTQLVELAVRVGLKGLSITDHDTVEAYQEAEKAVRENDLLLISGAEFSATHQGTSVHILAYSFPIDSVLIQEFCSKHYRRRLNRNKEILALLTAKGMPLSESDLQTTHLSVGRPHIALAMMKKGYVSTIQEAFVNYIGEGKCCYAPGGYFTVEETIGIIHEAGGLAVIAHPHLIHDYRIVNELTEMPFDGIEGYYARFLSADEEKWVKLGEKKGWLITGGSDFHGDIKPNNPLGSSWVNRETFQILYRHYNNRLVAGA